MTDFIDKEVVLELNIDDVKNALYYLKKNDKYLNLNGNVFSIDNITTCFNIEEYTSDCFERGSEHYFRFSYNDGNIKQVFKVMCKLNDDTSYGFLKNSTFMDYDQFCSLVQKVYSMVDNVKEYNLGSISNDLYNEALIFVTSGINKEECKAIKDDFESKYEAFVKKQDEKNAEISNEMKKLYMTLIETKF